MSAQKQIRICIPSYKRAECRTLELIPSATVYICKDDEEAYRRTHPETTFKVMPDGVQGNLPRVKNYILDDCTRDGMWGCVIIDDDVHSIARSVSRGAVPGYDQLKLDEDGILDMVAEGFQLCEDWGFKHWGIGCAGSMPGANPRNVPFRTTAYIAGPFGAFILDGMRLRFDEVIFLKEDYDMTIQQCRLYRGALRMNFYNIICEQGCKGNQSSGGCTSQRNRERERKHNEELQRKWGSHIVRFGKSQKRDYDMNPRIYIPIAGV